MPLKSSGIPDEQHLVARVRAGDEKAFQVLVQRHEQQVRATVYGMLGQAEGVDDLAQEVFIRLYQKIHELRGEAKLGTYLVRIAINLSLNELKRRQRKNRWIVGWDTDNAKSALPDLGAHPEKFETRELVQRGLQQLEPDFRSVIVLRLLDGFSVRETAEILGLPQGTVASRLARGQEKLREILKGWV